MDKESVDLRIDAQWIVPIEPAGSLTGHALLVDAGRVVALLPAAVADAAYAPRQALAFPSHVLLPGLVNAHTHSAMTLLRGIADDVPLKPWLEDHIWPCEARFVSPEFVFDGTLLAAAEMLRGGVTCCNDMYFYPEAAARAYESTGMRALVGAPVLDFPTPYAADADAYLARGLEARDAFRHVPHLSFALAPHAPYTVGDAAWSSIVTYARQLDLPIQTHLAETRDEVERALATTGMTPLARLDALGATGPGFIAIHAVHLGDADIAMLTAQGCHVVHCPTSNLKLASGIAPVSALLAAGVNIALGTDGAASNNRLDLFAEMRLASLLAKIATGDAAAGPAATVLRMATLNGARALGLDRVTGSLEVGKDADVIAVDLSELATQPVFDPVSHLVNVVGRDCVTDVWVRGVRMLSDRRLDTVDVPDVLMRTRAWQHRLATACRLPHRLP
ncbi:MAG: TRZ/ATZ family hydrolase [Burkholderiales bacterium]|nr:TRZ/ATZ family hydrolase [Burkholderiales bacterium]